MTPGQAALLKKRWKKRALGAQQSDVLRLVRRIQIERAEQTCESMNKNRI
jgi:hypothetical protein